MKVINKFLIFGGLIALVSCSDIFETNISNKSVDLVAPSDSAKNKVYATTFWWNQVDGALNYRLQIVSPSFQNISSFILDTTISKTRFTYTLSPGSYQWRVMALNGSSQTSYSTRTLSIIPTSLDSQTVVLNNSDLGAFKSSSITFSWQSLPGATSYTLEIDSVNGNNFITQANIKNTSYAVNMTKDGIYNWKVNATNGTKTSLDPIPLGTITIDNTPPTKVTNLSGTSPLTAKTNTNLTWSASTDQLSGVLFYKLYAYTKGTNDSTFISNYNPATVQASSSPSQIFSYPTSNTTIYWRVVAVDKAGNESPISSASLIKIQ
jgi:hypothetical protein